MKESKTEEKKLPKKIVKFDFDIKKILAASVLDADNKTDAIQKLIAHGISWIHYDIMDGEFVEKRSLMKFQVEEIIYNTNKHVVDMHLMVNDFEWYIEQYKEFADYITIHIEVEQAKQRIYKAVKENEKVGIAINPDTSLDNIVPIIKECPIILLMSVQPGKGGQSFKEETLHKVEQLVEIRKKLNLDYIIQVDGGVNGEVIDDLIKVGADVMVSGTYVMNNIETLPEIIKGMNGH